MSGNHSLALDVGGANIKAAHSNGDVKSIRFALWREPARLPTMLANLAELLPPFERIALTMTAELCDCFATKAEGVRAVVDAVEGLAKGRSVWIWGIDGRFHGPASIREQPLLAAASNWLALATVAARFTVGPALLIDVGSTTSDLIPLQDGRPVPRGRTDTERLVTGELLYVGVRRTPLCALATELNYRGVPTGLCAELFATTLDVYLTLGQIPADPHDLETADGRPSTVEAARDRLARMVGADRETFTPSDALELARDAHSRLLRRLIESASRASGQIGRPEHLIVSGSGGFLAHLVAEGFAVGQDRIVSLVEEWGPGASDAACARALLSLADEESRARGLLP